MGLLNLRWGILAGYGPLFVSGLFTTLELTGVSVAAGLLLGIVLVFCPASCWHK